MADSGRIEELRRRVQLDPASIAFAALAEEYRRAGRYDEAVATCRAGLLRHPAYLSARVTLGRALLEMGQLAEARAELEHVLRIAPENLAAIRCLAELHHRRAEPSDDFEAAHLAIHAEQEPVQEAALTPDPAPIRLIESPPVSEIVREAPIGTPQPHLAAASVKEPADTSMSMPLPEPAQGDEALAALEAFLAAVRRARETMPSGETLFRTPTDR
jgi:tetratricopeptide (TPR) repeat protein